MRLSYETSHNKLDLIPDTKPWSEWRHGNKRRWVAGMKVKQRKQQRAKNREAFQQEIYE